MDRYRYPDWLRRHSWLVHEAAVAVADGLAGAGERVDVERVALGAALHDIGKSPLLEGEDREHGELSGLVLAAEDLSGLVEIARRHVVYAIRDLQLAPRTLEEKIVYYADRRTGLEIVSIERRLREQAERFPRWSAEILACRLPCEALERELFSRLSFRPEDLCGPR